MSTLIPQERIRAAINSLENEKSPGQDNLGAEVFKADPQLAADLLQPLLRDIWEEKNLPKDRTEGVIVKIPKKGEESTQAFGKERDAQTRSLSCVTL